MAKSSLYKVVEEVEPEKKEAYAKFSTQCTLYKESSEMCITNLMKYYIVPIEPLLHDLPQLENLNIPFHFRYGEIDFVDTDFELKDKKISQQLIEMGYDCKVYPKAEHNLQYAEPEQLAHALKHLGEANENRV